MAVDLFFFLTVAVVAAFFICWAPFHAQRIMAVYGGLFKQSVNCWFHRIYSILTYISGILFFLSTCINPLLYSLMSNKFRRAFRVSIDK
jgi:neuromedin U receptor 1